MHELVNDSRASIVYDWNWLLSDNLDAAEPLADIVFGLGLLLCVASVGGCAYYAWRSFREAPEMEE